MATIKSALKYPFAKFGRLFYWLWIFLPIIGWLALAGYNLRIIKDILKGNHKEVPKFGPFWDNCRLGLYAFVVGIAVGLVTAGFSFLQMPMGIAGSVIYFAVAIYVGLISPIMVIQLAETESISKAFDVVRAHKIVFKNFRKYIIVMLQQFVVSLVLLLASIPVITLIFTLPAISYSKQYLYSRFYAELKSKPKY